MTTGLIVLQPDDAWQVAMLHAAAFPDPWSAAAFRDLLSESTSLGLGLEQHGALAGFILIQTVVGEADILSVATRPDLRRTGIASRLLPALLARLGERGVARITLDVAEDNPGARRLYESFGFSVDGRRPGYYTSGRDVPVAAILMSKSLSL